MEYTATTKLRLASPVGRDHQNQWVTPSMALAKYVVDSNYPSGYPYGASLVIRETESGQWVVYQPTTAKILAGTGVYGLSSPTVSTDGLLIRFGNGVLRADWLWLEYSDNVWQLRDWPDINEDIPDTDDEGYPRLCEVHTQPDSVYDWLAQFEESDSMDLESQIPSEAIWADYWVDQHYMCSAHFDSAYPDVFYSQSYDHDYGWLGDYKAEIVAYCEQSEYALQTRETVPSLEVIPSENLSWSMATGRLARVAEEKAKRAQNQFLESVVEGYVAGLVSRDLALASGVGANYLELLDDRERVKETGARP